MIPLEEKHGKSPPAKALEHGTCTRGGVYDFLPLFAFANAGSAGSPLARADVAPAVGNLSKWPGLSVSRWGLACSAVVPELEVGFAARNHLQANYGGDPVQDWLYDGDFHRHQARQRGSRVDHWSSLAHLIGSVLSAVVRLPHCVSA